VPVMTVGDRTVVCDINEGLEGTIPGGSDLPRAVAVRNKKIVFIGDNL
jgi:hypothetical protein